MYERGIYNVPSLVSDELTLGECKNGNLVEVDNINLALYIVLNSLFVITALKTIADQRAWAGAGVALAIKRVCASPMR